MSYSLDVGSYFTFNLLKFYPKYCFKKILHEEKLHFLVFFLLKNNLKCTKMTQSRYLKGTPLLKPVAIPQWHTLDQTLLE